MNEVQNSGKLPIRSKERGKINLVFNELQRVFSIVHLDGKTKAATELISHERLLLQPT